VWLDRFGGSDDLPSHKTDFTPYNACLGGVSPCPFSPLSCCSLVGPIPRSSRCPLAPFFPFAPHFFSLSPFSWHDPSVFPSTLLVVSIFPAGGLCRRGGWGLPIAGSSIRLLSDSFGQPTPPSFQLCFGCGAGGSWGGGFFFLTLGARWGNTNFGVHPPPKDFVFESLFFFLAFQIYIDPGFFSLWCAIPGFC